MTLHENRQTAQHESLQPIGISSFHRFSPSQRCHFISSNRHSCQPHARPADLQDPQQPQTGIARQAVHSQSQLSTASHSSEPHTKYYHIYCICLYSHLYHHSMITIVRFQHSSEPFQPYQPNSSHNISHTHHETQHRHCLYYLDSQCSTAQRSLFLPPRQQQHA